MIEDAVGALFVLVAGTAAMYWLLYSTRKPLKTIGLGAAAFAGYGLLAGAFIAIVYLLFRLVSLLL